MLSARATRTIERSGERARLASWRDGDRVAHLSPMAAAPLSAEFVGRCVEWLRDRGYRSVVTSALSSAEGDGFRSAGFAVQEDLDVLAHDLRAIPPRGRGVRRVRPADRPAVLDVDTRSFPPFWQLHEGGLADALSATPHVRFRVGEAAGRTVAGYVIAGRGGGAGYLQRLAVHPAARGAGLGRVLVADALTWMRRRGALRAFVNTQRANDGARELYLACGFRLLPERLEVLVREL